MNARRINTLFASTPFDPRSIVGLKLWLAADRITGLSDGDPVATWGDLSGNGNDVTQATAAKKPLYKLGIQNGKPGVLFDGVDDFLTRSSFVVAQPFTVLAVVRFGASASNDYVFDAASGSRAVMGLNPQGGGNTRAPGFYAGNASGLQAAANVSVPSTHLLSAKFNGASSVMRRNGTQTVSGNAGANNLGSLNLGINQGLSFPLHGHLFEAVVVPNLSDADSLRLENYLNLKYAIY